MKKEIRTWATKGKWYHEAEIKQMAKFYDTKGVTITFDDSKKRSTEQNAYVHAVVFPLIMEFFKYCSDLL